MKAPAERGVGRGKEREGRGAQGGKGSAESEKRDDCQESVRAHPAEKRCVITLKTVPAMRVRSEHNTVFWVDIRTCFPTCVKAAFWIHYFLKWGGWSRGTMPVKSEANALILLCVSFVCSTQTRS